MRYNEQNAKQLATAARFNEECRIKQARNTCQGSKAVKAALRKRDIKVDIHAELETLDF